jgi:predicted N-acetyltransferase YhbS
MAKRSPQPVPALLLGRLAVDYRHTGLGVGTALVIHVLATALEINAKAACKAVVVVALDEQARSWWERLGFHPFDPSDPACFYLYLLTNEVGRTIADLEDRPGR